MDALTAVRQLAARQDMIVTRSEASRLGLAGHEIDSLHRGGRWRRLLWGVYLIDADVCPEPSRQAWARAAVMSFGPGATTVLQTAAELHGIEGLRRSDEIHISVPVDRPRPQRTADRARVRVHQLTIPRRHRVAVAGIPATSAIWTVSDLLLRADRYPAVCVLDSALNRQLLHPADLGQIPELVRGRRGAVAARRYLAEADGRAQSPLETRARLRCVDGRVPPEGLQVDVRDSDGYLLAVGDLGWLGARVIAEADGAGPHGTPEAVFQDRWRQNRMVNAGWRVLRFTWADTLKPDYIPYVVRQAIDRRNVA